jgi:hypothetical protein
LRLHGSRLVGVVLIAIACLMLTRVLVVSPEAGCPAGGADSALVRPSQAMGG